LTNTVPHQLLKSFTLPNIGEVKGPGVVVVVGPNSSGKTQLLKDLHRRLTGTAEPLAVCESIETEIPNDFDDLLSYLFDQGYIAKVLDQPDQIKPEVTDSSMTAAMPILSQQQLRGYFSSHSPITGRGRVSRSEFLNQISKFFVSALFIGSRFNTINKVQIIPYDSQPPQSDLHALDKNDNAKKLLSSEINSSFNKDVWPDKSDGSGVSLKVSEKPFPSATDKLSIPKMQNYRSIENEGDGLKSYVAICMQLLLGRKSAVLIDEPELCLHPPQAQRLGQFVGSIGIENVWTIVATHSSQFLRGILAANRETRIVRLFRRNGAFNAQYMGHEELKQILHAPKLYSESALDGLFADCVVIVEADNDRMVYQTAIDKLKSDHPLDIHFAISSGTGSISGLASAYRKLDIPTVVLCDLDLIFDPTLLDRTLRSLGTKDDLNSILSTADEVAKLIAAARSKLEPEAIENLCKALKNLPTVDSAKRTSTANKLHEIANKIDPKAKLFEGWLGQLDDATRKKLVELIQKCENYGLFLVPVGAVEDWKSLGLENTYAKGNWAMNAAERIQAQDVTDDEFWQYVKKSLDHLKRQIDGT
jgi:predicted ATP-dependent endonuclease of OLD family